MTVECAISIDFEAVRCIAQVTTRCSELRTPVGSLQRIVTRISHQLTNLCFVHPRTLLLRLIKFTVLISVCTHFVACLWYILGCQAGTCRSGTWAGTASLVNTTVDDADHHLNSLYWSMATMATTGPTDIMLCLV